MKEIFALIQVVSDELDAVLEKFHFWKTMRVCAWIARFTRNARTTKKKRVKESLSTEEIEMQIQFWVKRAQQQSSQGSDQFERDRLQLNLQPNNEGILECRGRIQGQYPIYLPDSHSFTKKLITEAHLKTLHGGIGLTMTEVRQQYWVPRLRRLANKTIKSCKGCSRFQAKAFATPPPGKLPTDRTEGSEAFEIVGVDFAGPIKYRKKKNQEGKA